MKASRLFEIESSHLLASLNLLEENEFDFRENGSYSNTP